MVDLCESDGADAAEGGGAVLGRAEGSLHLDVADAGEVDGGVEGIEGDEGAGDGVFGGAAGVGFDGVREEAVEALGEVRRDGSEFGGLGDFGGAGDDVAALVRGEEAKRGGVGFGGEFAEAVEGVFGAAHHKCN